MAAGEPGDRINKQDIFDLMYPIGSIYINVNNTNPSTFFGGTWVQIEDSFLLSAGSSYTGGTTGGAAAVSYTPGGTVGSHTLTTSEIPSHAHSLNSHTHGLNGHTHSLNGHTHSLNGHAHSIPDHSHNYYYFRTQTQRVTDGQAANLISGSGGSAQPLATSGWSGTTGGNSGNTGGNSGNTGGNSGNTTGATGNTGNSGSGGGHNHGFTGTAATINTLPPYLVVYVWKRTA